VQGDTKSLDGSVLIWDRGDVGVVTRVSIDEGFLHILFPFRSQFWSLCQLECQI